MVLFKNPLGPTLGNDVLGSFSSLRGIVLGTLGVLERGGSDVLVTLLLRIPAFRVVCNAGVVLLMVVLHVFPFGTGSY